MYTYNPFSTNIRYIDISKNTASHFNTLLFPKNSFTDFGIRDVAGTTPVTILRELPYYFQGDIHGRTALFGCTYNDWRICTSSLSNIFTITDQIKLRSK